MDNNRFKIATILLSVILVLAAGFGSFSFMQISNDLEDSKDQIADLTSDLNSIEGLVSGLQAQLGISNNLITALNQKTDDLLNASTAIEDAIVKVMPSVVFIEAAVEGPDGQVFTGSGSGVIMDSSGYILTNKHVVAGAFAARVITPDLRIYDVEDIWEDDITDLAVVKITAQNLKAATFGDSSSVNVGDQVLALGYPLGMSPIDGGANVSSGIVGNLGRFFWIEDVPYYDLMEIDAAINPGNSGGALINLKAELIGINSAGTDGAQGINYAINVATAKHVYEDLVEYGQGGHHPYLGLFVDDNIEDIPGEPFASRLVGAEIVDLDSNGPAAEAGLRFGDIVLTFNGEKIGSASDFIRILWRLDVGDKATLVVKRGGSELTIEVIMPERPFDTPFV